MNQIKAMDNGHESPNREEHFSAAPSVSITFNGQRFDVQTHFRQSDAESFQVKVERLMRRDFLTQEGRTERV